MVDGPLNDCSGDWKCHLVRLRDDLFVRVGQRKVPSCRFNHEYKTFSDRTTDWEQSIMDTRSEMMAFRLKNVTLLGASSSCLIQAVR